MAIAADGRFLPNATKGALELFSPTDMARVLHKLNCGLSRDQVALIASAYEQLFTPATVRRSNRGMVRERLMKRVQDLFPSARRAQPGALACERLQQEVLDVRDGDWAGLYVRLAVALGMDSAAAECAHAVVRLRREQGKKGEDAMFATEQFAEMWPESDRAALDSTRELEAILRDVTRTCITVAQQRVLDGFKAAVDVQRREHSKARERRWLGRPSSRHETAAKA